MIYKLLMQIKYLYWEIKIFKFTKTSKVMKKCHVPKKSTYNSPNAKNKGLFSQPLISEFNLTNELQDHYEALAQTK